MNSFTNYTADDQPQETEQSFAAKLRDVFPDEVSFLIPQQIPRGAQTEMVSVRIPVEAGRALNEIIHRPGSLHKTKGDLLRVAINHLLAHIHYLSESEDSAWLALVTQGKMLANYHAAQLAQRSLYYGSVALRDSLVLQLKAGMVQDALSTYKDFLNKVLVGRQDWVLMSSRVLRDMPAAQMVAWVFRSSGEIPEYLDLVPSGEPGWRDLDTNMGLPNNPDAPNSSGGEEEIRMERAAYQRGYQAGVKAGHR